MASEPHPQVQALLEQLDQMGTPELSTLDPAEARTLFEELRSGDSSESVGDVTDRTIPGPGGDLPIRVYSPDGERPHPVLVYFHGGGWVVGSIDTHDSVCRHLTNAADCAVVSVDYRLAPEHPFPAPTEDAVAAVEWVAENGAEIGVDADRLAVGGDSAGGNLAAVAALVARDRGGPDIDRQVLIYPATSARDDWPSVAENDEGYLLTRSEMEWFGDQFFESPLDARNPYAFPLQACDHGGLPPATVVTAGFDPLRDEGQAYADALADAGVDVTVRNYEGMIHGFVDMLEDPVELDRAREAIETIGEDLRESFE
ncbi:alpha/beta hydrolase [Halorussus sp. MSC15.2]|uniref:alpha/beta hydrolase n=1 Tax=Halorussus sp. MSC15.2 TaxID=2283638 RepID=UPI0013D5F98C|nr:alpha/beta hydrolase [Halorussus sp. MSC15.2]NEU56190.1 alpha/beta hydrolase [Halorussus sp. MSC15.2]